MSDRDEVDLEQLDIADDDPSTEDAEQSAPDSTSTDERMAEGVDHLQHAAREMIAAARTFLDVVEEVVADSAAVASVSEVLRSMGDAVSRAANRAVRAASRRHPRATRTIGRLPHSARGRPGRHGSGL